MRPTGKKGEAMLQQGAITGDTRQNCKNALNQFVLLKLVQTPTAHTSNVAFCFPMMTVMSTFVLHAQVNISGAIN